MASESELKDWTIMVYMAGDNNLSVDMAYALKDIKQVAAARGDKINLMVYYDGGSLNTPTLYCDVSDFKAPKYVPAYTVPQRYEYRDRKGRPRLNPSNINSATMYSILNFVDWCVDEKKANKKAHKYALIFSGHGFGFQSISFLKDDSSNYYMTLRKFRVSLEKICKEILERDKIDLIGFDCCVMGMLEVGYEIHSYAETMIASEGSIPNAGWTYGNILGDLVCTSADPATGQVAKKFVSDFINSQKEYAVAGISVDMSAWDLSKVGHVVSAANKLGELLLRGLLKKSNVYEPLRSALLKAHLESQSYMFEQNVDLKDFCGLLLDATKYLESDETVSLKGEKEGNFVAKLKEGCKKVMDAVDSCILESGFSGGVYQFSNGIAIFFPWTFQTYLFSEKSYEGLNFARNGGGNWNAFLLHFLRDVTLRQPNDRNGQLNKILPSAQDNEKTSANPAFNIIEAAKNEISNAGGRIIANPVNRLYNYPSYRVIENAASRIIANPANKIVDNPANRIIDNPKNRMLGGIGSILSDFKNVAMPWDIFGYSNDESNGRPEKSEVARSGG